METAERNTTTFGSLKHTKTVVACDVFKGCPNRKMYFNSTDHKAIKFKNALVYN